MTSCRLQSNYSVTVTVHGGPVMLRPVRVTLCYVRDNKKNIFAFWQENYLQRTETVIEE